jgi:hypothetical protein
MDKIPTYAIKISCYEIKYRKYSKAFLIIIILLEYPFLALHDLKCKEERR